MLPQVNEAPLSSLVGPRPQRGAGMAGGVPPRQSMLLVWGGASVCSPGVFLKVGERDRCGDAVTPSWSPQPFLPRRMWAERSSQAVHLCCPRKGASQAEGGSAPLSMTVPPSTQPYYCGSKTNGKLWTLLSPGPSGEERGEKEPVPKGWGSIRPLLAGENGSLLNPSRNGEGD